MTYFQERFQKEYGTKYAQFLAVDFNPPPKLCPFCHTETIRKLWLKDPAAKGGVRWGKWYMWCQSCLHGIYCPPGTYIVPEGEESIAWGDSDTLEKALPVGLKLIVPEPGT